MEENYKLAKWLNGELTPEELASFESEPDYHLYKKIRDYSSELTLSDFNEQPLLTKILAEKKEPKTVKLPLRWLGRIAAVMVVGLGMYLALTTFSAQTKTAENGKQVSFSLPDNSAVVLNSGSEIRYKKWNWESNRNLTLSGEAYFKVAKGQQFQVTTALGNVRVLGTQFNVRARNNRLDVTCFEGRVQVDYKQQQLIIEKGQTVAFTAGQKIIDTKTELQKPYWTMDQIAFDQATLTDVLDEIERQYNIVIAIETRNSTQLFSGKLPGNDVDIALEAIATTFHLRVIKRSATHYALEPTK